MREPAPRPQGRRDGQTAGFPPAHVTAPAGDVGLVIDVLTRACNLRCRYCHEDAGAEEGRAAEAGGETARWLLGQTRRPAVRWVFHGGEPLLVGREHLEERRQHIASLAALTGVSVSFGVQSNGVLIDDRWAEWFAEHRVQVSLSMDGPPEVNDVWRQGGARVEQAVRLLRDRGVRPGVVCLLTPANVGRVRKVAAYFRSLGVRSVRFNLAWSVGRGAGLRLVDPGAFGRAKGELLDLMLEEDSSGVDRELFHQARQFLVTRRGDRRPGGICSARPCGAGRKVVALTPEGAFTVCGRALGLGGGLGVLAFAGEAVAPARWAVRLGRFHRVNGVTEACDRCRARGWCSGSCAAFAWQSSTTAACRYWQVLNEEMERRATNLAALVRRHSRSRVREAAPR